MTRTTWRLHKFDNNDVSYLHTISGDKLTFTVTAPKWQTLGDATVCIDPGYIKIDTYTEELDLIMYCRFGSNISKLATYETINQR